MPTLTETRQALKSKQDEFNAWCSEHTSADKKGLDLNGEGVAEFNRRNDELTELGKEYESLREVDIRLNGTREMLQGLLARDTEPTHRPGEQPRTDSAAGAIPTRDRTPAGKQLSLLDCRNGVGLFSPEGKSLADMFIEGEAYKAARESRLLGQSSMKFGAMVDDVHLKAVMTTTAGFPPFVQRQPGVLLSSQRRPLVATLIPQDATDQSAVAYVEETVFTNNAAPVSENAAKPESALEYAERTIPLSTIATHLPVTNQQLEDVPQLRALIDNRLTLMLLLAEENQLLNGNGTPPQLQGFYGKTGILNDARPATTNGPDFIYNGMVRIRTTTFEADITGIIFNPLDWVKFRLMKTTQGNYVWGDPSEVGPERVWGLDIVQTMAATQGKVLLGDFQLYSHISRRHGIRIDVADQHADDFTYNRIRIRAEERCSLEIYRPPAFWIGSNLETWDGSTFPS